MESVYSAVRTESYIKHIRFVFKGLIFVCQFAIQYSVVQIHFYGKPPLLSALIGSRIFSNAQNVATSLKLAAQKQQHHILCHVAP
jgi:hypothetical protein